MKKRTWEYGTKYAVVVVSADSKLMVMHSKEINEGFMLMNHGEKILPKCGDFGIITFTKGGPTGGYWKWQPIDSTKTE